VNTTNQLLQAAEKGNSRAALCVARPALSNPEPEVRGNSPDQRVTIERAGGQRLERVSPQPGQQPGGFSGGAAPGDWLPTPSGRSRRHSPGIRPQTHAGRAGGTSEGACRTRGPMGFRNKENQLPQAAEDAPARFGGDTTT